MSGYRFQSVRTDLANVLRRAMSEHPRPFTHGLTVGTHIRTDRPMTDSAPLLVVRQDGPGRVRQRVHQQTPLRVLAYHRDEDLTDDLIQHAYAVITAADTTGTPIRSVRPDDTAPWVDIDPDTGNPLGAFTCTVNTIAQRLS